MASEIFERGALVKSLAGHDEGEVLVIIEVVDGNYVLIANGRTRKVNNPKRKKTKHIKLLNTKIDLEHFEKNGGLTDGDIQKAIKETIKKIGG
ncbi:MAG: KOW domain-containing RNA-binding protein [Clostridia bacterium]|nr:KOW domain-containing RNA-binding protein [Clostridia bacterium]MBR2968645.1 KOW domain-containing RNA-binding protein [Clostridia bacterium]